MAFDLILRNGRVMLPGGKLAMADLGVSSGRLAAIGNLSGKAAGEEMNCSGLHILPGVIDSQVHFREPGLEHKENLETGARAAALGGVTAVFEMPNTDPATTAPEFLSDKLERARGRMAVDHAFYAGATHQNAHLLAKMEAMPGCCGVKVFMGASTGSLLVSDDAGIAAVLAATTRRVAFHSEDEDRLQARQHLARSGDWASHMQVRDAKAALDSTRRLLALAKAADRNVHILHVSTAAEMALLAGEKKLASVEVTPQHLTLSAPQAYQRLSGYAQMNPPIRTEKHRQALWQGVVNGVVDVIGSDHAPHTSEEKAKPYPQSPSGMPGVQTLVAVMLTHVAEGRLSLERFVELTSAGPQRLFGIVGKGQIAQGYDADFTIVDMKASKTITHSMQASRCGWTPFDGFEAKAWPVATIIRGQIIMRDDQILQEGQGLAVRFGQRHAFADQEGL